ncbi:MAG: hypothetical protein R3E04_09870 [Sphingobium sp.]
MFGNSLKDRMARLNSAAEDHRSRLLSLVDTSRDRLRPKALAEQAGNKALDLGLNGIDRAKATVRAHPVKAVGAAVIAGALLARRPLWKLATAGIAAGRAYLERTGPDEIAEESED